MVKNLVIKKLSSILTKHFKDVNEKTLELALLSGVCTLNNLELRTENIQKYFNFKINSISVGSITLKYSLMSLFYKPIEVYINDFKVSIDKNIEFKKEDFLFEKLKFLEIETNKSAKSGAVGSLFLQFYEKAIISIKNIEILINTADEEEINPESKLFRINIESINTTTVDENWHENTDFNNLNEYFKIFEINKFTIDYGRKNITNARELKCRIVVKKNHFDEDKPDIDIDLMIPILNAKMEIKLYEQIIKCINIYNFQKSMKKIIKDNLNLFDIYTRKELGTMNKFGAIMKILEQNPIVLDSEELSKSKIKFYSELYQKFTTGKLTDEENRQMSEFEENENVDFILKIRKKVVDDKKLIPKRRFFFWTQNVTEEETKNLCKDLQIEEKKENVSSFKISFLVKRFELLLSTEKHSINFILDSLSIKHNSMENRSNCVLKNIGIFEGNDFLVKSLEEENYALFHYEKDKILLSFNHLNIKKIYILTNMVSRYLNSKVENFNRKNIEIKCKMFENKKLHIETNDIKYLCDDDKKEIIFKPFFISGDIAEIKIQSEGIFINNLEQNQISMVFDKFLIEFFMNMDENKIKIIGRTDELRINEKYIIENIGLMKNEIREFQSYEKKTESKLNLPDIVFNIKNIYLSYLDITLKNPKIQIIRNNFELIIDRLNFCGIKILNINVIFKEIMLIRNLEIIINLENFDIIKCKKSVNNLMNTSSKLPETKSNNDNCLDFMDLLCINQISIIFIDASHSYNLSIEKITGSQIINTTLNLGNSSIFIRKISLGQKVLNFDGIDLNRHPCLSDNIQNIFFYLKKYNFVPISDKPSTLEFCINLNNVEIINHNISNYPSFICKTKNIHMNISSSFQFISNLELFTCDKKNNISIVIDFLKTINDKSGTSKILGTSNTEFVRTITHTLIGIIDLILIFLNNIYIQKNEIAFLKWDSILDLTLNDSLKNEFLFNIKGEVELLTKNGFLYEPDKFDESGDYYLYSDSQKRHLLSHQIFYQNSKLQRETYNIIDIDCKRILGYDQNSNISIFINEMKINIVKNMYSMYVDFNMKTVFTFLEIYQILILKQNFIPIDLSFGLPTVNNEVVVHGKISEIFYKNICLKDFSILDNQIKFNFVSFVDTINFDQTLAKISKNLPDHISIAFTDLIHRHNSIYTPAVISISIITDIESMKYNIEINDLYIRNGDIYKDYIQFFLLILNDIEKINKMSIVEKKKASIFSIECRTIQVIFLHKILIHFEYIHLLNTLEKPSIYEGCFIAHSDALSNRLLEKHFYTLQFTNNLLTIKGHDILRGTILKAMFKNNVQKKITFINSSDLKCDLLYDNKVIKPNDSIFYNDFVNYSLKLTYGYHNLFIKIMNNTIEFLNDKKVYFIDVSVRNEEILIRVFSNVIFKNYTNLNLDIHFGDENVSISNFRNKITLHEFEDGSFSYNEPDILYFRLFPKGWTDGQDVYNCTDGVYVCNVKQTSLKMNYRKGLLFLCDGSFRFLCVDFIIVEKNGYRIFYTLIYIPLFINNCTGVDLSFIFRNKTYKFSKEIKILGLVSTDDENQPTTEYDEIIHKNLHMLPFSNISDSIELGFQNSDNKYTIINLKGKRDSEIVLNQEKRYGLMYERKERIIHNIPYLTNIEEIIIYPFYIVNNGLDKSIYLGHTLIQTGRNFIDFINKKVKLIFDKNFKSPNEINLGSVELFVILKLQDHEANSSNAKYFSTKSVFGKITQTKISSNNSKKFKDKKLLCIEKVRYNKNIALEMNFGSGKYANTRIINLNFANIIQNCTKFVFLLSVGNEIFILSPGESRDIHFGENDFFYIFFCDKFGFEEIEEIQNEQENYQYFFIDGKMYRLIQKTDKYLKYSGSFVNVKGLSPKFFTLKRETSILFKLITFIRGKQRFIKINTETKWPIMIKNNTKENICICQIKSQKKYLIRQNETLNYCFDFLYKEKILVIHYHNRIIKFSINDVTIKEQGLNITLYNKDDIIVIEVDYESKVLEDPINIIFELNLFLPFLSLSICDKNEEVCIHARNLELKVKSIMIRDEGRIVYDLSCSSIQIDDQNIERKFPIIMNAKMKEFNMLYSQEKIKMPFFRIFLEMTQNSKQISDETIQNTIDYYDWRIICFSFLIQEFYLRIDEDLLNTMISFFQEDEKHKFILQCNYCSNIICSCYLKVKPPCKYIKIESLLINPMILSVNFRKTKDSTGIVKKGLSLLFYNISDYKIKFDAEFLNNIDNPILSIQEVIINHYKTQIYRDLFKFLLSVDLLGNIGSFTDTFSMGIKDLFYEPFIGSSIEDPKKMSLSILKGGTSLVKHTVSGVSGIFSKISDGLSKNISLVTFDKDFQNYNKNLYLGYIDDISLCIKDPKLSKNMALKPISEGYDRFVDSISSGVTGIIEKPLEGANSGFKGFVKGIGKGCIGIVAKPAVGLFDMIGGLAEGIKSGMDGGRLCRLQYPRFSLQCDYNYEQNMSYYIYLRYITNSAPKFIRGELRDNQHIILTDGMIFIFNKKASIEIYFNEINVIGDTHFGYKGKRITASRSFIVDLENLRNEKLVQDL